ncbi:MarR family winged helix-turn-helix transcriptional regulator [Roseovarius sp. EL26]|uniref:MarR family winged helix-turn-helix transcriptional regulator n=1 Tax=Roseovarius sp. EL26 TaxID=2126672 RepID=UPI000EA3AED4|nr:MarR family transcriptional regulator [Roseovarius sp. EL26]
MADRIPIQDLLARIKTNWPAADAPETDIVFMILRFQDLIRMNTEEVLGKFNLSHASFEILVALRAQPNPRQLTPTELYRSALLSSGGTTKILIQLESRGLIERASNPMDGRSKIVCLTASGETLVESAMTEVMTYDRELFSKLDDVVDITQLKNVLDVALSAVES